LEIIYSFKKRLFGFYIFEIFLEIIYSFKKRLLGFYSFEIFLEIIYSFKKDYSDSIVLRSSWKLFIFKKA